MAAVMTMIANDGDNDEHRSIAIELVTRRPARAADIAYSCLRHGDTGRRMSDR